MATTGIGSGLCEGNVLAMVIEGPGGTDRGRALCQVGQDDKQGQGVQLGCWHVGRLRGPGRNPRFNKRSSSLHTSRYCPSLVLLCATYIL